MSFGEVILLSVLVFLLFGPKKTAGIARQMAQAIAGIKRTVYDLQASLSMQSVTLPPEAITDPTIEAQRQTIFGVTPDGTTAMTGDAAGTQEDASSPAPHAKAGPAPVSEAMYV